MNRRDWLLLFAAFEGAPDGLDPVRVQKGMFLFAMQAPVPENEKYSFKPYDYGPMSGAIYRDLDTLVGDGLLTQTPVPGKRWSRYAASDVGRARGQQLMSGAPGEARAAARELHQIKQRVATVSFDELLEDVYDDYPDYAINSVFRRA